jgi:hypothetical protein
MATKISFCVLLSVFFVITGFLGFSNGVGAETLKMQVSNVVTKSEIFPLENIEATSINYMVRDGTFILENGEVGSMKAMVTSAGTVGKGGLFLGFIVYMFGDGSTIVGTFQPGTFWADPEKKVMGLQKASGELIMGSGRFKGIKGTQTMTGKLLKLIKGESLPKVYNDFILTYTLSP